jgi:hypothetical protein
MIEVYIYPSRPEPNLIRAGGEENGSVPAVTRPEQLSSNQVSYTYFLNSTVTTTFFNSTVLFIIGGGGGGS